MMKFLADQNLRFRTVSELKNNGYDILHTSEIGFETIEDEIVLQRAIAENRILITFVLDLET